MKYYILFIISALSVQLSYSQIHEIGVFVGGSNFIGDVGRTNFIAPNQFAIGGIYKWNRSRRHSYRLSLMYTDLQGVDTDSDDPRREQRGYSFNSSILELSVGMEFTFWEYDLHNGKNVSAPYLFAGFSATKHDNFYFRDGQLRDENTSSIAYGIPFGLGYKALVMDRFVVGLEIGARYTFSDELDGSVPDAKELEAFSFGNLNNDDWYVFTGLTLTYTFGKNPCFCVYD